MQSFFSFTCLYIRNTLYLGNFTIMKQLITILILLFTINQSFSQTIELTFTAEYNSQHIQMDSVYIRNQSQSSDTVLYYPDTVLYISNVGMYEFEPANSVLAVSQNYPNPFTHQTFVNIYLSKDELISICVFDIMGRKLAGYENNLSAGKHVFSFYGGMDNYYLFSVTTPYEKKMIKMFGCGNETRDYCKLVYDGMSGDQRMMKAVNSSFVYSQGDLLSYIGYTTISGNKGSGLIDDVPTNTETYVFDIEEDGVPCPGTPTVTDIDGNVYATVRIGGQCWMAENLKTTRYQDGSSIDYPGINETLWDTITSGAYAWYDNDTAYKNIYGGLYNGYTILNSTSVCPIGWHVPSDEEWCILENYVERGTDTYCDIMGHNERGKNSGRILKSCRTTPGSGVPAACETNQQPVWSYYNNDFGYDTYSFSAIPGGRRMNSYPLNNYWGLSDDGCYWTTGIYVYESNGYSSLFYRWFDSDEFYVWRGPAGTMQDGFSIRCIKD